MAEAWGIPPWEVEAQATKLWADRWAAWNNAKADKQEYQSKPKAGGGSQQGGQHRRRLI